MSLQPEKVEEGNTIVIFDGWGSPTEPPQEPRGTRPEPDPAAATAGATPQNRPQPEHDERHWQAAAACRGNAAALFDFAHDERGPSGRARVSAAKQVCVACTVRAQCLQFALAHAEPHGIWGGLTPQEREQLARGKQSGPAGSTGHPSGRATS